MTEAIIPAYGKSKPVKKGDHVADASDVETSGDRSAQQDLDALGESSLNWLFSPITTALNPGAGNLALNNAEKDLATIISFNTTSSSHLARFDEFLPRLRAGDRVLLQSRTGINFSILYRVTGDPEVDGTKVNVPVARERDQGSEFVDGEVLDVKFFLQLTATESGFLQQVSFLSARYIFGSSVQVLDDNLTEVTLPVNAPYDQVARYLFGGASLEHNNVAGVVTYTSGYSLGVDYRDNAEGTLNDATHYVDVAGGVSITSNLAASQIDYPVGTTLQRLIAVKLGLNTGLSGTGAMIVFENDAAAEFEFMHVTTANKIELDLAPASGSGTHQAIQDEFGDVVIDDGTWLILEFIPKPGSSVMWRIVPALLKADGTRITANDIDIDMTDIVGTVVGISRSANQRGQVTEYKLVQTPGYLSHDDLSTRFDHAADKWCFGFARLFGASSEDLVEIVRKLKGPIESTLGVPLPSPSNAGFIARVNAAGTAYEAAELARDITATAIGASPNAHVLTLPTDYNDFELLTFEIIEDAGQSMHNTVSTRRLESGNIPNYRIAGNDTAAWLTSSRTLTLDSTSDIWVNAILSVPRPPKP